VVVLANFPRLARDAFYYSAMSRTDRYYQVIRGGEYAGLVELARYLRQSARPGDRVAVRHDRSAVLHYLSGRMVVPFPRRHPRQTVADAEDILRQVLPDQRVCFVVPDTADGAPAFLHRLRRGLEESRQFEPVLAKSRYRLYRRRVAASGPFIERRRAGPSSRTAPRASRRPLRPA